ncbi:hypothetical protein D3C72_2173420 [compost metagenome]
MQIHADTMPLDLQSLSEFERAKTQALFARPRFRFDNRRAFGLFSSTDCKEIWRQKIGNRLRVFNIPRRIAARLQTGAAQRPDNVTLRLQGHMEAGLEIMFDNRC